MSGGALIANDTVKNLGAWGSLFVVTCAVAFTAAIYRADQKQVPFNVTCTNDATSMVVFNGLAKKNYKLNGSHHVHAVNDKGDITVHKFKKNQFLCEGIKPSLR